MMKLFSRPGKSWAARHKRIVAALLAAALVGTLVLPAFAAEESTPKQEVVYVNLNDDGSVSEIYVVNIFDLEKAGKIVDYGDYTSVRNMTTKDEIQFENGTVRINAGAGKLYYEGKLDGTAIPWDFSVKYRLDGQEISAGELGGRSGALEICLSIRRNPKGDKDFFENYGLQMSLTLDTEKCRNISAPEATAANVGKNRQLTYTVLPDSEKDFTVTADVTDFEMPAIAINGLPLNMDVELEDSQTGELDEKMDELTDAVTELDDGAGELLDGAIELRDGAKELDDGAAELLDGALELRDGTGELYDGARELRDGAKELNRGAGELRDGAKQLRDGAADLESGVSDAGAGASQLKTGAAQAAQGAKALSDGLSALSGSSQTLNDGAYTVFVQLTGAAETQLNQALAGAGLGSVSLTPENYDSVISGLLDTLSGGAYSQVEDFVRAQVREQVEAAAAQQVEETIRGSEETMAQIEAGVEAQYGEQISTDAQSYAALAFAQAQYPDDPEGWLQTPEGQAAVQAFLATEQGQAALANAREQVKAQYLEAAVQQQIDSQLESGAFQAQVDAIVAQQMASEEIRQRIADAVEEALGDSDAYQGIIALKAQLDSYNAFYQGLGQYTAGVDSAAAGAGTLTQGTAALSSGASALYSGLVKLEKGAGELYDGARSLYNGADELKDGAKELYDGAGELYDGAGELRDGVRELYDGAAELKDGTGELHDGTVELYDGVVELKDGTGEFREKTAGLDTELKDKINEAIREMLGSDFEAGSFVSEKNTQVELVQFVIQTGPVNTQQAVEEPVVEEQPSLTFWQKLKRLFGLE